MQLANNSRSSHSSAWRQIRSLPVRLAVSVRQHGLPAICRRSWRRVRESAREWKLGIRTGGSIDAAALKSGAGNFGYQPIPYAAFDIALQQIPFAADDVFVDLGCGMGRAVILAGLNPVRRVIGVEISPQLCTLARDNVRRASRHLCAEAIEIIESDATEYRLPDDTTVLLLFNPFDEPVVRRVLENVRQSLQQHPRDLTIIYATPNTRPDVLADVPWLQLERKPLVPDEPWLRLALYRSRETAT